MPQTYFHYGMLVGKTVDQLLDNAGTEGVPWLNAWDASWLRINENKASPETVSAVGRKGFDINGTHCSNKTLTAGTPTIFVGDYARMSHFENYNNTAKTSGLIDRATGVTIDDNGRIGMFINGYDTPSDVESNGVVKPYGPDIHVGRVGKSQPIFLGPDNPQCLHMVCNLELGKMYFDPPAVSDETRQYGAGGQIGFRISFRRNDGRLFGSGVGIQEIIVLSGFWDSREGGNGRDSVGNVTAGESWIGAPLTSDDSSKFVKMYSGAELHGRQSNRDQTFYWNIERQNMLNILAAIGATDTTPEDMRVSGTSFNCELFDNRPNAAQEFKPGQFGFNLSNMIVDIW